MHPHPLSIRRDLTGATLTPKLKNHKVLLNLGLKEAKVRDQSRSQDSDLKLMVQAPHYLVPRKTTMLKDRLCQELEKMMGQVLRIRQLEKYLNL